MILVTAPALAMTDEQRATLEKMARSTMLGHRQVVQAKALLLAGDGVQIGVHGDLQGRIAGVDNADHGRLRRVKRGSRTSREPLELLV